MRQQSVRKHKSRYREEHPMEVGTDDMPDKSPGKYLKALRMRAGVSSTDLGKVLGFSNANGYLRYENNPPYTTGRKIPGRIITSIIPHLVGRGEPPVTRDELISISDMADLADVMGEIKQSEQWTRAAMGQPSFVFPKPGAAGGPALPVRFRVERDVYVPSQKLSERISGTSMCLPDPRFPADVQFAALVADDSCGDYAPAGSILHCIEPGAAGEIAPSQMVLIQASIGPLSEVIVAAYAHKARDQTVIGVPIWRLIPG